MLVILGEKNHGCIPYGANLTPFGPKSDRTVSYTVYTIYKMSPRQRELVNICSFPLLQLLYSKLSSTPIVPIFNFNWLQATSFDALLPQNSGLFFSTAQVTTEKVLTQS